MSDKVLSEMEYRKNRAARILFDRIMRYCHGQVMSKQLIQQVEQLVYDHRSECRRKGIDFPVLVVFPLIETGAVHTYPADLDEKGIQTAVLNMTVQYPNCTMRELVAGVCHAWPGFKGFGNLNYTRPKTLELSN